jgi:hypothetical protein
MNAVTGTRGPSLSDAYPVPIMKKLTAPIMVGMLFMFVNGVVLGF